MADLLKMTIKGRAAARLALVRLRIADLKERRRAFEEGVLERRKALEEEQRLLEEEEAKAEADLINQRKELLEKVKVFLKGEKEIEHLNLEGIEKDESRWQLLLANVKDRITEKKMPLATPEDVRQCIP